jgi:hypothetical protein
MGFESFVFFRVTGLEQELKGGWEDWAGVGKQVFRGLVSVNGNEFNQHSSATCLGRLVRYNALVGDIVGGTERYAPGG